MLIQNPVDKKNYRINSKKGKIILHKYLMRSGMTGGGFLSWIASSVVPPAAQVAQAAQISPMAQMTGEKTNGNGMMSKLMDLLKSAGDAADEDASKQNPQTATVPASSVPTTAQNNLGTEPGTATVEQQLRKQLQASNSELESKKVEINHLKNTITVLANSGKMPSESTST